MGIPTVKVSIIIPVYNEAQTVLTLLENTWAAPTPGIEKELVVVESNSADGTRERVQRFCDEKRGMRPDGIRLVLQERAMGKGSAVREGIAASTGDIILIQDGDLEYSAHDYPALLQPIVDRKAAFVLGSRIMGLRTWKIRKFPGAPVKEWYLNIGGVLFHAFFNLMYQQRLTDPTTMFKVFRRDCLDEITLVSDRFDLDWEIVAKLVRQGFVPLEVPISYNSRGFDEGKKTLLFSDPLNWISAIVRFRFCPLKVSRQDRETRPERPPLRNS
jgi:glycosyltransferase involved in cell wall biosynthesis